MFAPDRAVQAADQLPLVYTTPGPASFPCHIHLNARTIFSLSSTKNPILVSTLALHCGLLAF